MDPVHTEWLHAYQMHYVMDRKGEPVPRDDQGRYIVQRHVRIGFDVFEHGIYKRRLLEGQSEDHDDWLSGHPVLFPTILKTTGSVGWRARSRSAFPWTIRIPCTTCTAAQKRGPAEPMQDGVPVYDLPLYNDDGQFRIDVTIVQDFMAWATQGPVADRTVEKLGESDKGILLYRRMLKQQLDIAADGGDPSTSSASLRPTESSTWQRAAAVPAPPDERRRTAAVGSAAAQDVRGCALPRGLSALPRAGRPKSSRRSALSAAARRAWGRGGGCSVAAAQVRRPHLAGAAGHQRLHAARRAVLRELSLEASVDLRRLILVLNLDAALPDADVGAALRGASAPYAAEAQRQVARGCGAVLKC